MGGARKTPGTAVAVGEAIRAYDEKHRLPMSPGYYWAKWRIASNGTHEGDELTPSDTWEIVQVNANVLGWEDNPAEDEALSVAVPGVREVQWRDCFVWGQRVAPLADHSYFGRVKNAAARAKGSA